ncbi:uncharacterized protein N7469_003475 [Penicillium citrinum]|uniref:RRM domain-containing protein n=1 Tax=Penicillium citrinum TaxID=5077 RepID=A0A9W9TPX4_PENCI|nr:uncharacterized protein N7469_003475 [Penicillium citrinum]KAJ5234307.1 hypothetical protein N7469_003475 [Penicillium citrinum]
MTVIIGHTTPFGQSETEKQVELRRVRKIVYDVFREFCAARGRPLSASVHAPPRIREREKAEHLRKAAGKVQSAPILQRDSQESPEAKSQRVLKKSSLDAGNATVQILPVSLSDSGTTAAQSGPTPSQDPDPEKTPTGSPVRRGVRSPEEFMKSFRSASALGFNLGGSTAAPRRIIFTDVPEWASISDILGLVHGGAVDRVFVQGAGSVAVQFCEEESCQKYIDTYTSGIRIEGAVIKVAKAPTTDKMIPSLTALINKGASRVVRAGNIPLSMSLQDVHQLVRNLHVEHILYNARPGCPGSAYLFFCSITHGHKFLDKIRDQEPWEHCEAGFVIDPCQAASTFHGNTIPYQMANAEAV